MYEVDENSLPESLYLEELRKYADLDAPISVSQFCFWSGCRRRFDAFPLASGPS